jgi:thiol-disulfide isomerase/thioredoxin
MKNHFKSKPFLIGACLIALLTGWTIYKMDAWIFQKKLLQQENQYALKDREGNVHTQDELKGHPSVVHFWANWCVPCAEELPEFMERVKSEKDTRIKWVFISLDPTWEDAEKILKPEMKIPGVIYLLDPKNEVPPRFGSYQYPETVLLNPELRTVFKWVGSQKWGMPEVSTPIRQLLAEIPNQ